MRACRQTKDIWFYLFGRYPGGKWRGWTLFERRFWRHRGHLWHDSFGKYWNRFAGCALKHGGVKNISEPMEPVEWYCFDCERRVPRKGGEE